MPPAKTAAGMARNIAIESVSNDARSALDRVNQVQAQIKKILELQAKLIELVKTTTQQTSQRRTARQQRRALRQGKQAARDTELNSFLSRLTQTLGLPTFAPSSTSLSRNFETVLQSARLKSTAQNLQQLLSWVQQRKTGGAADSVGASVDDIISQAARLATQGATPASVAPMVVAVKAAPVLATSSAVVSPYSTFARL